MFELALENSTLHSSKALSTAYFWRRYCLPDYFVDAFRYSQETGAYVLTDDALLLEHYKQLGESPIPRYFSSFSLVRVMTEKKLISWEAYLKYFALASYYRYHFLILSADDMIRAVFPLATGGLVSFAPKNISYLKLQLTLSHEYGVDDRTASSVLSSFFTKLIQDDSVPPAMADEIFALTIRQGLAQRDKRLMARVVFQICQQNMLERNWKSQGSKTKLNILDKQLSGFAQGIDPIVIEAPLLLRVTDSLPYNLK